MLGRGGIHGWKERWRLGEIQGGEGLGVAAGVGSWTLVQQATLEEEVCSAMRTSRGTPASMAGRVSPWPSRQGAPRAEKLRAPGWTQENARAGTSSTELELSVRVMELDVGVPGRTMEDRGELK